MEKIKRIILFILISSAFVVTIGTVFFTWTYVTVKNSTVGELTFTNKLHIPDLLEPTIDKEGRKVFT